jgi:flagellar hook-basal body complex protein FliE
MPAIDPAMLTIGGDWSVGLEAAPKPAGGGSGVSFGDIMAKQVQSLGELQSEAAGASREVAMGTAADPSSAVLAIERARLAMQLATAVRTKLTEAVNDVMHTQV